MSIKCPHCGEVFDQSINFCRKCGKALATAPINQTEMMATQEMAGVLTKQLGADTATAPVKKAEPVQADPFDTWEPQKQVAGTEVLTATATLVNQSKTAEVITPAATAGLVTEAAPKPDKTPAPQNSPVAATPAKVNRLGVLAIAALVLCSIVGGAVYFMRPGPPPAPMPTTEVVTNAPTVTETQAPAIAANVTDSTNVAPIAAPGASPLIGKTASPRPTVTPSAGKLAVAKTEETVAAPSAAPTYTNEIAKGTDKVEATPNSTSVVSGPNYITQGNQHLSAKQFPEAIAAYQKAQRANPSNADIHYLMGSAYHQMGQLNEALAQYRQCNAGSYASVAANHVKNLEKKLKKSQ